MSVLSISWKIICFQKSLTSNVPAFLLLSEALPLAHVVQEVEEKVDIVGTLGQNLLLINNIIPCFAAFRSYPNHIERDY